MPFTMSTSMPYPQQQHFQQPQPYHVAVPQGAIASNAMAPAQYPHVNLGPLRTQVEFYFSPQNLVKDTYLLSHLNSSDHLGAVPISVLCSFPKVRQVYSLLNNMGHLPLHFMPMADPMLVRMAVYQSSVVAVSQDGAWISPRETSWMQQQQRGQPSDVSFITSAGSNASEDPRAEQSAPSSPSSQATASSSLGVPTHPLPPAAPISSSSKDLSASYGRGARNVIIVRDIPPDVAAEEVLNVFRSDHISPKTARPDVGNIWFVTFDTGEQALQALTASQDSTIAGTPIRGCLKSDIRPQATAGAAPSAFDGASEGVSSVEASATSSSVTNSWSSYAVMNPGMPPLQAIPMYGGHPYPIIMPAAGYAISMQQPQRSSHQTPYGGHVPYGTSNMRGQSYYPYRHGGVGYPMRSMNQQQRNYTTHGKPPNHVFLRRTSKERNESKGTGEYKQTGNDRSMNQASTKGTSSGGKKSQNTVKAWQPKQNIKKAESMSKPQGKQQHKAAAARSGKGTREGKGQRTNSDDKSTSRKDKRQDKSETKELNLNAENFPDLGGRVVNTVIQESKATLNSTIPGGYVQALLKKRDIPVTQVCSPITVSTAPANIELDVDMSKMAFSEDSVSNDAAYGDW